VDFCVAVGRLADDRETPVRPVPECGIRQDRGGVTVVDTARTNRRWTVFGHPVGLVNRFSGEMWERFSHCGMVAIVGYYLYGAVTEGGLGLPEDTALGIVGAYGAVVWLATVPGGWIADRVLGMERAVFYGRVVAMLGHLSLAVLPRLDGLGVGVVSIAVGPGALTATAFSLPGTLYRKQDARADGRFTPLYPGINLGALLGPLITGFLQTGPASTSGSAPPPWAWRSNRPST
jgi:POT family proton-dependent oligopeptide transporter